MSGDDGLREPIARAAFEAVQDPEDAYPVEWEDNYARSDEYAIAAAVLALPEVAALRAKAAAADRVRELHRPSDRGTGPQCQGCATHVSFRPWPCPTILELDGDGS